MPHRKSYSTLVTTDDNGKIIKVERYNDGGPDTSEGSTAGSKLSKTFSDRSSTHNNGSASTSLSSGADTIRPSSSISHRVPPSRSSTRQKATPSYPFHPIPVISEADTQDDSFIRGRSPRPRTTALPHEAVPWEAREQYDYQQPAAIDRFLKTPPSAPGSVLSGPSTGAETSPAHGKIPRSRRIEAPPTRRDARSNLRTGSARSHGTSTIKSH